jgi:hypothetical protein
MHDPTQVETAVEASKQELELLRGDLVRKSHHQIPRAPLAERISQVTPDKTDGPQPHMGRDVRLKAMKIFKSTKNTSNLFLSSLGFYV